MAKKRVDFKKILNSYWLVFVFILVFFLRLPSLFEPFTYGDEGIYLALGQAVRRGLVLYRDIHDNKPPLLYLMAALAGNFPNFRLILFIWSFATVYLFFRLSQLLFGKKKSAVIISTLFFAIASSVRIFEGNIANAENFMLGTTIAGFYLFLIAKKWHQYFLAGILFSLSALFKVPAAFDFAAVLAFAFIVAKKKNYKLQITNYFLLISGFLLPILTTLIHYASQNALKQYLVAAFSQNIPYLSSWSPNRPQLVGFPLPLILRVSLVLVVIVLLFIFRRRLSKPFLATVPWFSFALFATLLSSRPYPHYLLQTVPPLSFSFGLIFEKNREKILPWLISAILLFSMVFFKFWYYPSLSYYQNFYTFSLGLKTKDEYFSYFGKEAKSLYQAAGYIKTRTTKDEKIFIWGTQPSIYPLSERAPVGRYTVAYHIIDFNGYDETMKALGESPPNYLIQVLSEKRPFPALEAFIASYYIRVKTIEDIEIYRHL